MKSHAKQLDITDFRLDRVPPGTKQRIRLIIDNLPDGTQLAFSAVVARGEQRGNVILATGGVHGDEYEGPLAIMDIYDELDVASMRGDFFGIPVLNGPAFVAARREGEWDRLNLARTFPGSETGSPSERIAHSFSEYLVGQADLFLDVHSGGNNYAIKEFAGYQVRSGALGMVQKEAAIAFGLDLVWGTSPLPGRSLSAAAEKKVAAIYVEMRGEGRCRSDQLEKAKRGVRNVLAYLEIINRPFPMTAPRYCFEAVSEESGHLQIEHPSPTSGIFLPTVKLWDKVEQGSVLGRVRHPDGTVLAEVTSEKSGRLLLLRTLPRVFSGDCLASVIELPCDLI